MLDASVASIMPLIIFQPCDWCLMLSQVLNGPGLFGGFALAMVAMLIML